MTDDGSDRHRASRVSIVVPAYNAERFVARTLESALAQDYTSFEIIVVDDGSTDSTARIVSDYARTDPRIRLISTVNQGVAAARNTGIQASAAEYVAFLDADDLWTSDKLRLQVEVLDSKEDHAAAYAWSVSIDEDDGVLWPNASWIFDGFVLCRHLVTWPVGNGSSLLVRRSAAVAVGGFDPDFRRLACGGAEDLDFELRIVERYRIACVPKFLIGYRRYEGNMSSDGRRMARSAVRAVRNALERNPDLPRACTRWARGTAYRYAADSCRPSADFLRYLTALLVSDPGFGARYVAARALRLMGRFRRLRPRRAAKPREFVHFYAWSPGPLSGPDPMIRRRVERLTPVDGRLEVENGPGRIPAPAALIG